MAIDIANNEAKKPKAKPEVCTSDMTWAANKKSSTSQFISTTALDLTFISLMPIYLFKAEKNRVSNSQNMSID